MKRFQTEEQCAELLFKFRWPDGFICLKCGHVRFYRLKRRGL
ncbi:MAG: transposase, partial [Synergistaceae bacterium]|nr:transposase [Synergistaceae bacterium]